MTGCLEYAFTERRRVKSLASDFASFVPERTDFVPERTDIQVWNGGSVCQRVVFQTFGVESSGVPASATARPGGRHARLQARAC